MNFGDLLYETECAMLGNLAEWSIRWRENAERLATIKPLFVAEKGAKEFTEWRRNLGFSDATASKMLTVARYVPWEIEDLRTIGGVKLYALARAVRDGADFEEASEDARVLSVSEFEARWITTKPHAKAEKRGVCPHCGYSDSLEQFEKSKEPPEGGSEARVP